MQNKCSPDEAKQVLEWLASEDYNEKQSDAINELLTEAISTQHHLESDVKNQLNERWDAILKSIEDGDSNNPESEKVRTISWWRWVAAALFIISLSGSVFYLLNSKSNKNSPIATVNERRENADIMPGGNKAVLILDNGKQMILEDVGDGRLAQQGNSIVIKDGNNLKYNENNKNGNVVYNTVITPKGGQYQLSLADGTKVWLNSSSSIHFPVAFNASGRRVEITGEVYFEVAPDVSKPFVVSFTTADKNKSEITVLGTRFNVMAYSDEEVSKTTLLAGSIKLACNGKEAILLPRQQASLKDQSLNILNNVNIDEVIAWKNGYFQFDGASLEQVMRQVARWYDVSVVYKGGVPNRKFGGKIPMNSNLSEVIKIFKASNVKFTIEGKTIIIE